MRLSANEIRRAFEKTGMKPIRRSFGDGSQGCGMQAYSHAHEELKGKPRLVSLNVTGRAYFEGFTTGWDYGPRGALSNDKIMRLYGATGLFEYFDGVEDGHKAAEEMFAEELALA